MMEYNEAVVRMSMAIVSTMGHDCIINLSKNKKRIAKLAIDMIDAVEAELCAEYEKEVDSPPESGV